MRFRQPPRATVVAISPVGDNKVNVSFSYDLGVIEAIKKLNPLYYSYSPTNRSWTVSRLKLEELLDNLQFYAVKLNGDFPELKSKKEEIKNGLKGVKPCVDFQFKGTPFSHQIAGFNFMYQRSGAILGDAMKRMDLQILIYLMFLDVLPLLQSGLKLLILKHYI